VVPSGRGRSKGEYLGSVEAQDRRGSTWPRECERLADQQEQVRCEPLFGARQRAIQRTTVRITDSPRERHGPRIDTASSPWPTIITLAVGFSRSGSAWLGRSQKDGLPSCREGSHRKPVQGHRLALEGAATVLPLSNREQKWTSRTATLVCLPPCHSFVRICLDGRSRCFQRRLSCARCSCDCRGSREILARKLSSPAPPLTRTDVDTAKPPWPTNITSRLARRPSC
jgi:hypothetical protein